jgi:hypothetical protein
MRMVRSTYFAGVGQVNAQCEILHGMGAIAVRCFLSIGFLAALLPAQTTESDRIRELEARLETYRRLFVDWGGLTRYGSENTELPAPKSGENRVVFLGDDITENWNPAFFTGKPFLNRGIAGQTTPQMLVRFRQDVIALKPKVVHILAGMHDLAGRMGPATQGTMVENFQSLVELARANGIRVVLGSLLPVCDCYTNQTAVRPVGKIVGMNAWLRDYAKESGSGYADY